MVGVQEGAKHGFQFRGGGPSQEVEVYHCINRYVRRSMLWGLNNGSPDLTPDARGSPTRRSAVSYQGGKVGNPRSGKPNLIAPINQDRQWVAPTAYMPTG